MAVRNFWISADIDGRRTNLAGGPRAKDGGFDLTVYQRDNGSVSKALEITGRACDDGRLMVRVWSPACNQGGTVHVNSCDVSHNGGPEIEVVSER